MFFRLMFLSSALALTACGRGPVATPTGTGSGTGTGTGAGTGSGTGTGTGAGTGSGTGTGTGSATGGDCSSPPGGPGIWNDSQDVHPIAEAGGSITGTAYTHDAGLAAVIADATGEFYPVTVDLTITGAIVAAKGYVPDPNTGEVELWLEDRAGVVYTRYVNTMTAGGIDPLTIMPGDAVTMHVTKVQEYYGTMQVAEIDSFSIDSSDNPIYVMDGMTGAAIDSSTNQDRSFEVYGKLVSEPVACGSGRECFDIDYGSGTLAEFRTGAGFQFNGDCVHFIGPVGDFQGTPQLDASDYDWYRWW